MKESEVKTLPRSFKVLYLQVFITGDPAEIPLCPGGALKSIYQGLRNPFRFRTHLCLLESFLSTVRECD